MDTMNTLLSTIQELGPLDRSSCVCEMIIFGLSCALMDPTDFGITHEENLIRYASVLPAAEA